ncbi:hypothetical protein BJY52DRAFT_412960 [Lactarius psammicola]|nr:hypothetical protein BJY52DRAFT_412960 [Lactarius psammicola]
MLLIETHPLAHPCTPSDQSILMDGLHFVLDAPQLSQTYKKRPRLVASCDSCRLKKMKCVQVKSQPRCQACEAGNTHCQFRNRERYFAEQSRIVIGATAGPSPAHRRRSSSQSIERSAVGPTRGDSDHSDVMESFNTDKANLLPVLPSTIRDSRYRGAARVGVSPTIDPLGANLLSAPSYQSQQWTISAHPEGVRYAHIKSHSGITIVTEANISEPGVSDQLNVWLGVIWNTINEEHVHLLDNSDLFLEINQDAGTCHYYFADHGLRTVFWLHTLSTTIVGPPSSYSSSCLQYSPEENYWIHVELFPGTASQYSAKALNDLQVIFSNARTDVPTSETLTFPYTIKECEDFIKFLEHSKDHASSPYIVTCVARLWATVANHRFFIHSNEGPKHCQPSSNQSTSEVPKSRWGLVLAIISKMLLFGFPDRYEARFEGFWVDQLVDASCWREHASETVEDLKQTTVMGKLNRGCKGPSLLILSSKILALLGASIPTMQVSSSSGLVKASLFLCAFDLAVTSFLLQRQQRLLSTNTPTSTAYLKDWNTSYGLQPIAIIHSLPQALLVWALLLFSMQGLWMVFADLPLTPLLCTLLPVVAILVVVGLGIWLIVHPGPEPFEGAMLPPAISPSNIAAEQKERPTAETMV